MIAPFVRLALVAAFAAAAIPLTGCAPVIVAGAAGAALVATDRRSAGAQLDDTTIETKLAASYASTWGDRAHVSVTSYNGVVLLSGEVPDQAAWAEAGSRAKATDRVRAVHNELAVGPSTDLATRTNDTYITSKVKTRFVEANRFSATHVKVVTERGTVFLMGLVSRQEADAAGEIAATTSGVARVVRLFEVS
ncbi:MAG: BON domain-containing protein [Burkholderiales bacterium]